MSAVPAKPAGRSAERPSDPWRQRLIRSLLSGRNTNRPATARARVGLAMLAFAAVYAMIGGRLVMFAIGADAHSARRAASQEVVATARPDIVDRNGAILATDVKAASMFGEPRRIIDKDEAIELLTATVPDLDEAEVRDRLSSRKGFVWLKREITAKQQLDIHKLGLPGIGFLRENKRVYPTGNEVAHLIGLVNIDNQGIAGMEKWLDNQGLADLHRAGFAIDRLQKPIELSVDLRVEHALRDELLKAKEKFHTKAASGLVTNVNTGEIVAMVSVPDFDPNNPKEAHDPDRINRLTTGVYEMGSTFKAFTLAMALDTGKYGLDSLWDARGPLHYGKFAIHDDEPKGRFLNMKEVFTFSSNVGAARIVPQQIAQATKRVEGIVRIQLISAVLSSELDEAIASFHRRNPNIQIELRVSPWRDVLDALERGEVEIGIGYDSGARSGLVYEPLFVERQQLYCSRNHPRFGRRISRLGELKDEGFVLTGEDELEVVTRLRRRYALGSKVNGLAEDVNEAKRLIQLGVGIGFLPVLAAAGAVAKGRLWPLLHAELEPSYDIFLLARSEPSRDTATQLFLDEVIRRVRAQRRA